MALFDALKRWKLPAFPLKPIDVNKYEMLERIKFWVVKTIQFCRTLPKEPEYKVIYYQLSKCSSSSGANYSASNRGKSTSDFVNKRKMVEEELDESLYWLDLLKRLLPERLTEITPLEKEANLFLGHVVNSIKSQRGK